MNTPSLEQAAAYDGPEEQALRHVRLEEVTLAMRDLTDLQQQVLNLRFAADLSIAEVAKVMSRKEGAVKFLQYSALEECLELYPEHAAELEPVLRSAISVRAGLETDLPSTARARIRGRVLAEWDRQRQPIGVEVDAVRVMGLASIDAVVGVNGVPVEISADGSFQYDLDLEAGVNLIEVVATNLSGAAAFQERVVLFISTAAGLPFTLFYPSDGLVVSEPDIPVIGGTLPEAVVEVNGVPV